MSNNKIMNIRGVLIENPDPYTSIVNITGLSARSINGVVLLSKEQEKRHQWWLNKRHLWDISHAPQALIRQKKARSQRLQLMRNEKRKLTLYIPQLPTSVIPRHSPDFQLRFAELCCKNMDQLRQICREKNYWNFSQLTKTHLINHIMFSEYGRL